MVAASARRCPPGVFCIENVSFTFLAIIVTGIVVYFMKGSIQPQQQPQQQLQQQLQPQLQLQQQ